MIAKKHQCEHSINTLCTRGNGAPTRKRCKYCGGRIRTDEGLWGVFEWTGNGNYPLENALATFSTYGRAQKEADKRDAVVRFIHRTTAFPLIYADGSLGIVRAIV